MKNHPSPYSDKYRQFSSLSKRVNKLIRTGKFGELSYSVQQKLLRKLKGLYDVLSSVYSSLSLKKILASAAVLLGLSTTADAQVFAPPVKDTFNLQPTYYLSYPILIDLDGDGDLDLLSGEYYGAFQYFQNTGTVSSPSFAAPVQNPFGLSSLLYGSFPVGADMDGDGDIDILAIEGFSNFQYFQNTGSVTNPAFAAPVMNPFGLSSAYGSVYYLTPTLVDIDGDGDLDLFIGGQYNNVRYYQNTGTAQAPQFTTPVSNPFNLSFPINSYGIASVGFVDADKDGDYDLVYGNWDIIYSGYYYFNYNSKLRYYENTGTAINPNFIQSSASTFAVDTIADQKTIGISFADLDNDGDMDMMTGGVSITGSGYYYSYDGSFNYYKNISNFIGIHAPENILITVSPNPASEHINIHFPTSATMPDAVSIMNIKGQKLIDRKIDSPGMNIDISALPSGTYFVTLRKDGEIFGRKKFVISR